MATIEKTLNKEIMNTLSNEQKVLFLKTLLFFSKVDGEVDEGEVKFIKKMATKYKIEDIKKIFDPITEPELLSQLKLLAKRRIALELIKELFSLGHADSDLSDDEILFVGRVGQTLGVEVPKIEQISNWVIDYIVWQEQGKIIFEEE